MNQKAFQAQWSKKARALLSFLHFAASCQKVAIFRRQLHAGRSLGLALVNRFAELHDSWVEIETKANRGTTVRCHLPRRMREQDEGGDVRKAG